MTRKFINSENTVALPSPTKWKDTEASLSCKGFLRPQKPYDPPKGVRNKIFSVVKATLGRDFDVATKIDNDNKFKLLSACSQEFSHSVPNSLLHRMDTIGNVIEYYETPVVTATPIEQMKSMELPPNLHIQYDYHRFHPDTDTMFSGISAFPKSSTIVTGIKYKKKYSGYNAKKSWP